MRILVSTRIVVSLAAIAAVCATGMSTSESMAFVVGPP